MPMRENNSVHWGDALRNGVPPNCVAVALQLVRAVRVCRDRDAERVSQRDRRVRARLPVAARHERHRARVRFGGGRDDDIRQCVAAVDAHDRAAARQRRAARPEALLVVLDPPRDPRRDLDRRGDDRIEGLRPAPVAHDHARELVALEHGGEHADQTVAAGRVDQRGLPAAAAAAAAAVVRAQLRPDARKELAALEEFLAVHRLRRRECEPEARHQRVAAKQRARGIVGARRRPVTLGPQVEPVPRPDVQPNARVLVVQRGPRDEFDVALHDD